MIPSNLDRRVTKEGEKEVLEQKTVVSQTGDFDVLLLVLILIPDSVARMTPVVSCFRSRTLFLFPHASKRGGGRKRKRDMLTKSSIEAGDDECLTRDICYVS